MLWPIAGILRRSVNAIVGAMLPILNVVLLYEGLKGHQVVKPGNRKYS